MKGSYKTLMPSGKLYNSIGIGIHCLAEMLLKPDVMEVSLYNEASTKYRRLKDGTWVRTTSYSRTVRVEVIDLTPGNTICKKYKIQTGEKVDKYIQ